MGIVKEIMPGLKSLITDDPSQYVESNNLSHAIVMSMKDKKISSDKAAILVQKYKDMEKNGQELDEKQTSSIMISIYDRVIRAKTNFGMWLKQRKINGKLLKSITLMDETKKGKLPKDDTVIKAESTNGNLEQVPAGELENIEREPGGIEREKVD